MASRLCLARNSFGDSRLAKPCRQSCRGHPKCLEQKELDRTGENAMYERELVCFCYFEAQRIGSAAYSS
jgi:hypothetical protein